MERASRCPVVLLSFGAVHHHYSWGCQARVVWRSLAAEAAAKGVAATKPAFAGWDVGSGMEYRDGSQAQPHRRSGGGGGVVFIWNQS